MDGELAGLDTLFAASIGEEFFGERGAFAMGDHPADDITAEDIQHDVEIEVSPLGGSK